MLDTILVVVGFTGATICAVLAIRNNAKIHRLIKELEKKESELYMLRSARDAAQSALREAARRNPAPATTRKTETKRGRTPQGSAPAPAPHVHEITDDALGAAFLAGAATPSPYDHRSYSDSAPNHDSSHSYGGHSSHSSHDSGGSSYSSGSDSGGSFGGDSGGGF